MIGVFLAWVLGGWISEHYGWRHAFYLAGIPGIVLAIVIASVKVDKSSNATGIVKVARPSGTFREIFHNAPFMWLNLGSSLLTFVNIGLVSMLGIFFIRSHHMSVSTVGFIFGPVMSVGMACGLIGGGWFGNRLAERGVDALIIFTALVAFALFPIYLCVLLAPSSGLALAAMFVGAMVSTFYSPSHSASYLAVCSPDTRATAAGVHGFSNSLIGGGVTPFLVGVLSDHWRPQFGQDSLKYAMMVGLLTLLIAGLMFLQARRHLPRERSHDRHVAAV
jgi:sugar phosphate permease